MKAEDYFVYMDSDCLAYNHVPFLTMLPALIKDAIVIQYSRNCRRRDHYPILKESSEARLISNTQGISSEARLILNRRGRDRYPILKESSEARLILKESSETRSLSDTQGIVGDNDAINF